jgi:hypothetical protein
MAPPYLFTGIGVGLMQVAAIIGLLRWLHSGRHHRGGGSKAERCRVSRAATDCYASRVPYSSDRVHRDCIFMRSQAALGCNRIRFWHG